MMAQWPGFSGFASITITTRVRLPGTLAPVTAEYVMSALATTTSVDAAGGGHGQTAAGAGVEGIRAEFTCRCFPE
jgi:hypothetical protein